MGRDKAFPLDEEQERNLEHLLECLNKFRVLFGRPMTVSSGYRPAAINAKVKGAAKRSNHISCLACDFKDVDGYLANWCLKNLDKLEQCGLFLESPAHTPGWTHLQAVPPKSGNRVFLP